MITHRAYDYGILDFLGKTKTKRTLCGKTVNSDEIDNEKPTCPECQAEHAELESVAAHILKDI